MSILLFIVILIVLIVGHEFGHLLAAKFVGMRVLEFGIGFPPKLWGKKVGGTEYSVNALPFGGFVRIFGEDAKEALADAAAFSNRSPLAQTLVLFAGPLANLVLAFLLLSVALTIGVTTTIGPDTPGTVSNERVVVVSVVPGSPAESAGAKEGDRIRSITSSGAVTPVVDPDTLIRTIGGATDTVTLEIERAGEVLSLAAEPVLGLIADEPERRALGIGTARIGTVSLPVHEAVIAAFTKTVSNTILIVTGILGLIGEALSLSADLSNVAGPVGIASLVGDAAVFGVGSVLSFAALISINLAIVNLLPFPALDGGRLAFLAAESIFRKKIPLSVSNALNAVGFALLILLMIAVTAQDVARLVS